MTYDPKEHHRRSIRAKRYDYATCGAYFVTICTDGRQPLLGEIRNGIVGLSEVGCMVQMVWNELPLRYPGVETDAFVVMPNHVHGIVMLAGSGQARGPAPTLPMVVHRFKSFTTHQHGKALWQRNYFEHIVRNDRDLDRIREYIAVNPIRWSLDRENPHCIGEDEFDRWLRSFKSPVGAGPRACPSTTSP
jgi:REP element-mobilizing transposase RayT